MATIYVDADTKKAQLNIKKLQQDFQKFSNNAERDIGKVAKGMGLLKTAGAALAGVFAVGTIAQYTTELIALGDTYTNIDSKLNLVTDSTAEFNSVYEELYQLGRDTGSQLEVNAQSFSKLANAMPDAESKDLVKYLDIVNKSLVTSGTEAQEAAAFMLQWSQAMGSGVVAGDELKSMVESNSYLMGKLADELGTNIKGLKDLGSEGKLTSDLFAETLLKVGGEVSKEYEAMGLTVSRAMNDVREVLKRAFADANSGAGWTSGLAQGVSDFAQTLEDNREDISGAFEFFIAGAELAVASIGPLGTAWNVFVFSINEGLEIWLKSLRTLTTGFSLIASGMEGLGLIDVNPFDALDEAIATLEITTGAAMDNIKQDLNDVNNVEISPELDSSVAVEEVEKIEDAGKELVKAFEDGAEEITGANAAAAEHSGKAWEDYVKTVKKLNQDIVSDFKSISEEIRDIQREGMTDQEAWNDVLKQIEEYKTLATEAGDAGLWQEQKGYLDDIAGLIKGLPKDGVKGAAPTTQQIKNAKQMVQHWEDILKQQKTMSGKDTYGQKLTEAKAKLSALQKQEAEGGRAIITAEQSRKVRMEGLRDIQKEMIALNEAAAGTIGSEADKLKAISDVFSKDKFEPAKEAIKEISPVVVQVGTDFEKVGGVWVEVGEKMDGVIDSQVEKLHTAQEAIDDYISSLEEALRLEGQSTSGRSTQFPGYAVGGVVPGFGGTDSMIARLTPGEGVLTPLGLSALGGASALSQLNIGQNPLGQGSPDVVEMAFNFNKKTVGTLRGDRHATQKILDHFSDMNGALS